MMKKITFLFFIVALFALANAVDTTASATNIVQQTEATSSFEAVKDWRVLTGIAIMISIILVSTAFMIGHGFDMPDVKVWASGEFNQVFATAIIMIIFISVLSFLDVAVADIVRDSNLGFLCDFGENCGIKTANQYLNGLIDLGKASAKEAIEDQVSAGNIMGLKFGFYLTPFIFPIPLLQAAYSQSYTQGYVFDIDRDAVVLDYATAVLSGLVAQQFFVDQIAYKVAPAVLFIGILARTFFVTRKLGGLLIAIAIGVMYVFPLMYVLNWLTLNVTLFGGNILVPNVESGDCPAECKTQVPVFVTLAGNKINNFSAASVYFYGEGHTLNDAEYNELKAFESGTDGNEKEINGKKLRSCEALAHNDKGYCPVMCRELPYPSSPECTSKTTIVTLKCTGLSSLECKRKYTTGNTTLECTISGTITTLKCTGQGIETLNCTPEGTNTILECTGTQSEGPTPEAACIMMERSCKMIRYVDLNAHPEPTESGTNDILCRDECKVDMSLALKDGAQCLPCIKWPQYCRVGLTTDHNWRPSSDECGGATGCPCVYLIPPDDMLDSCSKCMFVSRAYTFKPPIYAATDCAALCDKNPTGPPKISPSQFTQKSKEMMYGEGKIKNVAALILPAYILLILDVTVTLMFIKTFSPVLGGDIDIPGISKIA